MRERQPTWAFHDAPHATPESSPPTGPVTTCAGLEPCNQTTGGTKTHFQSF